MIFQCILMSKKYYYDIIDIIYKINLVFTLLSGLTVDRLFHHLER